MECLLLFGPEYFPFRLVSKSTKSVIQIRIILRVVLHEDGTWSFILFEAVDVR